MPDLTQYQNVFRVAKPNVSKRGQDHRQRQRLNNVSVPEHGSHDESDKISKAQARLQKLEEMVTMLMQSSNGTAIRAGQLTPPIAYNSTESSIVTATSEVDLDNSVEVSPRTTSNGRLDVKGIETKYLGATHWASVLEDIKDIQDYLASESSEVGCDDLDVDALDEPDIIVSKANALTISDVMSSLPPRPITDQLLSVHFNARYLHIRKMHQPIDTTQDSNVQAFIHRGKFMREYDSFWSDPSSVSFLWISMLFSCLHLGHSISRATTNNNSQQHTAAFAKHFLTRAAQALLTGRYQKARPYSVEATMMYGMCKFFDKKDSDNEPWLIMGIAARLALRMGYHREPRHFAHISPFEGEMRRRTFSTVQTFELLLSFQAGLPAIIHEQVCDTEPAGNLFDDDFDENSAAIPPSRPVTDPTPMLYFCYKARLAQTFRKIARQALAPHLPAYPDVMQLDGEIRQVRAEVPPSLVWKPLRCCIADDRYAVMHRLNLELTYQKCVMILHRRYLNHDRSNPAYQYARGSCIAASFQTLQYQAELHQATKPGALLHNERWTASGIAMHDFLLAGTITCLDLYESYRESSKSVVPANKLHAQAKMYDALQTSQAIWQTQREMSPDAKRASNVLAVMLSKIPRPESHPPRSIDTILGSNTNVTGSFARMSFGDIQADEPQADVASGLTTATEEPYGANADQEMSNEGFPSQDFLDTVFPETEFLDWNVLDHYIQQGSSPLRSFTF